MKLTRDQKVRLTGGVAVFCDPGTYLSEEEMRHLWSQGYAVAIKACMSSKFDQLLPVVSMATDSVII